MPFFRHAVYGALAVVVLAAWTSDSPISIPSEIELKSLEIDRVANLVEIGARDTLSVIAVDVSDDTVQVPVVWRSSNEDVATFEYGGVFVAKDTGVTTI